MHDPLVLITNVLAKNYYLAKLPEVNCAHQALDKFPIFPFLSGGKNTYTMSYLAEPQILVESKSSPSDLIFVEGTSHLLSFS